MVRNDGSNCRKIEVMGLFTIYSGIMVDRWIL